MKELLFYSFTGIVSKTPKKEKAKHEEKISTLFCPSFVRLLSENRPICPKNAKTNFVRKSTRQKKTLIAFFYFFFTFLHRTFYRNVRKHTFESVFHYIFIKKSATKPTTTHFIHSMYIFNFVREFVRKCPKPQKFCPKMSED